MEQVTTQQCSLNVIFIPDLRGHFSIYSTVWSRINICHIGSILVSSVADPGCLSRLPDPDFYPSRIPDRGSRIPDPKTATKKRGKKIFCHIFFVVTNFTKLKCRRIKFWSSFQRIVKFFTQNLSLTSQKYGFGIRDPEKTYSRSRIWV